MNVLQDFKGCSEKLCVFMDVFWIIFQSFSEKMIGTTVIAF